MLGNRDDVKLTLFLRHAKKLKNVPKNSQIVQGDVLDKKQLGSGVKGTALQTSLSRAGHEDRFAKKGEIAKTASWADVRRGMGMSQVRTMSIGDKYRLLLPRDGSRRFQRRGRYVRPITTPTITHSTK